MPAFKDSIFRRHTCKIIEDLYFIRYYKGALAVVMLYDMTKHTSFQDVTQCWLEEVNEKSNVNNRVVILVGNKYDLRHLRTVSTEEGAKVAGDS